MLTGSILWVGMLDDVKNVKYCFQRSPSSDPAAAGKHFGLAAARSKKAAWQVEGGDFVTLQSGKRPHLETKHHTSSRTPFSTGTHGLWEEE